MDASNKNRLDVNKVIQLYFQNLCAANKMEKAMKLITDSVKENNVYNLRYLLVVVKLLDLNFENEIC